MANQAPVMARDAQINGDIFTVQTAHDEVHVFWARAR